MCCWKGGWWWWWYRSNLRSPELDLSLPWSIFRWAVFDLSESLQWLNFLFVDNVLWAFVSVLESVALFTMLCYFFLFCGCTL